MTFSRIKGNVISKLHDRLSWVIAVLVPITSLPLASNRPSWWLLWSGLFAALGFVFLVRSYGAAAGYRPQFRKYGFVFAVLLVVPVWSVIQTLPIAKFLPASLIPMPNGLEDLAASSISIEPHVALSGILRYLGYLILAALVIEVATRRERVLKFAYVVYTGICLQAIWALVALSLLGDFSPWGPKTAHLGSATGTFTNRNSLATFLGFGFVLGLGIIAERAARTGIRSSRKWVGLNKIGYGAFLIIVGQLFLFLGIVATQSRLGLASSFLGALVTFLIYRRQKGASVLRLMAEFSAIVVVGVLSVAVVAAGAGVAERALFAGNDAEVRGEIYRQTLSLITLRPFTGLGMDAYAQGFEAIRHPPLVIDATIDLAHNSYLMLWSEFGVVFGSAPLVALLAVAVILLRRLNGRDGFPGMAAAGLGVLVIGAVHSLGDFSLEIPANTYLFAAILGLAVGLRSHHARDDERAEAVVPTLEVVRPVADEKLPDDDLLVIEVKR